MSVLDHGAAHSPRHPRPGRNCRPRPSLPEQRDLEALVADVLAEQAHVADYLDSIISFAWPYLSRAERARVLTAALTPTVRAALQAQAGGII